MAEVFSAVTQGFQNRRIEIANSTGLVDPLRARDDRGGANDDSRCAQRNDVQFEMFTHLSAAHRSCEQGDFGKKIVSIPVPPGTRALAHLSCVSQRRPLLQQMGCRFLELSTSNLR
jgi:hypothetical protein